MESGYPLRTRHGSQVKFCTSDQKFDGILQGETLACSDKHYKIIITRWPQDALLENYFDSFLNIFLANSGDKTFYILSFPNLMFRSF